MPDIDYHRNAKNLIKDERLWDNSNMFSPHGNDTGNDVLHLVFKHNTSRSLNSMTDVQGQALYQKITRNWGVKAGIGPNDSIEYNAHRDIVLGLAFAQVKIHGYCEKWLQDTALKEIKVYHQYLDENELNWEYRGECRDHLTSMKQCLCKMPNSANNNGIISKTKGRVYKLLGKNKD